MCLNSLFNLRCLGFFLLVNSMISCSSHNISDKHLVSGSCANKFKRIELSPGQSLWENIEDGSGKGASYMLTGLAYSTDIIVIFGGAALVTIAVCSPFLVVDGLAKTNGALAQGCSSSINPSKLLDEINPKIGEKTYSATAKWRCPQVDPIGLALLDVASCYEKSGQGELAQEQIREILSSSLMNECLSDKIKTKIKKYKDSFVLDQK